MRCKKLTGFTDGSEGWKWTKAGHEVLAGLDNDPQHKESSGAPPAGDKTTTIDGCYAIEFSDDSTIYIAYHKHTVSVADNFSKKINPFATAVIKALKAVHVR